MLTSEHMSPDSMNEVCATNELNSASEPEALPFATPMPKTKSAALATTTIFFIA